jgi:hypothetical protein
MKPRAMPFVKVDRLKFLRLRMSLLLIIAIALMGVGCGGENSSFGKRKNPSDASSEPGAGDVGDVGLDAPSNNGVPDADPGEGDTSDTTGDCVETDEPDPSFEDANCDGIDGDREASVFVASYGDDTNDGSMSAPKKSIQAAIDAASQDPAKSWVLVEAAMFEESIELSDGVHLIGGYGFGWKREDGGPTLIRGGNPVVRGVDITTHTVISELAIEHNYEAGEGETIVGVYLERSGAVELRDVKITGGTAGSGASGVQGDSGESGSNGGRGGNGVEDSGGVFCSSNSRPSLGSAGTSACGGRAGGTGGRPGKGEGAGEKGSDGAGGALGGDGGAEKQGGRPGADGATGPSGVVGAGGDASGSFNGLQWVGIPGAPGERGGGGDGGGGGGGGGGGPANCDSWGGAGGGGGSGGCGGFPGQGGQPGGASVALFLVDSADVTLSGCEIFGGSGGTGGAGGQGGPGGQGGQGQSGGNGEDGSGVGGTGGDGGKGGVGGAGGGGAGGPSLAIYTDVELASEPVDTTVENGFGGQGGSSSSAAGRGAKGEAHTTFVAP